VTRHREHGHVATGLGDEGRGDDAAGTKLIPLEKMVTLTTDRLKADLGFIKLPDEFAAELAVSKSLSVFMM